MNTCAQSNVSWSVQCLFLVIWAAPTLVGNWVTGACVCVCERERERKRKREEKERGGEQDKGAVGRKRRLIFQFKRTNDFHTNYNSYIDISDVPWPTILHSGNKYCVIELLTVLLWLSGQFCWLCLCTSVLRLNSLLLSAHCLFLSEMS